MVKGRFKSGLAHFPSFRHVNWTSKHQKTTLRTFFFGLHNPGGPYSRCASSLCVRFVYLPCFYGRLSFVFCGCAVAVAILVGLARGGWASLFFSPSYSAAYLSKSHLAAMASAPQRAANVANFTSGLLKARVSAPSTESSRGVSVGYG